MALSDAHRAARVGKITSSIAAAALGMDEDKSPIDAWLEVKGEAQFEGNAATERGDILEDVTIAHGAKAANAARWEKPGLVQHPDIPWGGDSCDALYYDDWDDILALGEAKTVGMGNAHRFGEPMTDQVPDKVLIQCCWHLIHWPNVPRCYVPVLFGGYDFSFKCYVIKRNDDFNSQLVEDLARWHHDHITLDLQPSVTHRDSDFLKQRHPVGHRDLMLQTTSEFDQLVLDLLDAKEAVKEAKKQEDLLCNQVRAAMEHHGAARGADYTISYHNDKSRLVVDWEAIARHLKADEATVARHSEERPGSRTLRVSRRKMKEQK